MNSESHLTEFLLKKSGKLEQLCRVCLSENTEESRSLYEECESKSIASVVMLCARVQIFSQDGLPNIICAQCLGDLEAANSFRVRCELSDSLLRKVYSDSNQIKVQENGDVTETQDVKEEVSSNPWIKSEEVNDDSDAYDPLVENLTSDLPEFNGKNESKDKLYLPKKIDPILTPKSQDEIVNKCKKKFTDNQIKCSKKHVTLSRICKICGRPLSSIKALENHIESIHKDNKNIKFGVITGYGKHKLFKCTECQYTAKRRQALIYHTRTHTGEKPYKCDVCNVSFSQNGSLIIHKRTHSDQMYFTCPVCGKQFKHKHAYEMHKRVHSDIKNFTCELCNKGFKSKITLAIHIKRHLNIRNYSCEHCGQTFVTSEELRSHVKIHIVSAKLDCHICPFKTRIKRSLVRHLQRHTKEKNIKCKLCEFTTYEQCKLKFHMRKHTKVQNYSCPICQMKFIHSSSVNRHMMRKHKIEYRVNDHVDRRVIK